MMCGLLKPTEGTAKVVGLNLQSASSKARSRIGYMAQKFSLYGNLSVLQNLDFFSGVYGLGGKTRSEAIDRMIHTFNLQPYLNTSSGMLPLGFKQRLALACAVMHNPHVLFLDEPTSGVDPITRREFWTHINGLVEKGVTVMVTTHFMDEAEYCDRIALVYRGKIIALGEPDQLREEAASTETPNPTMEETFIKLIEEFDAKNQTSQTGAVA
jgi:ABC-2 type transport system ATP-binding protein